MNAFHTKTVNGNKSVDTAARSTMNAIWSNIMSGTVDSTIVDLFTARYNELMKKELSEDVVEQYIHILCLALRIRDFRNGGHGRRKESYVALLTVLFNLDEPVITKTMFSLMAGHYGRWKDLNDIYLMLDNGHFHYVPDNFTKISKEIILDLFVNQIKNELAGGELTQCSKWIFTEKKNTSIAIKIAQKMFPWMRKDTTYNDGKLVNENTQLKNQWHTLLKKYRKEIGKLRLRIPMIERNLCADTADEIDPSKIPGQALKFNRRALENLVSFRSKKPITEQRLTNPKRIKCAENLSVYVSATLEAAKVHRQKMDTLNAKLQECDNDAERIAIQEAINAAEQKFETSAPKVHGGDNVFIHDLVKQYGNEMAKNNTIEAQFQSMLQSIKILRQKRVLFVMDTSSSMTGLNPDGLTPSDIAMGLTALFASCASPEMRHKCIAFSNKPYVLDWSNMNDGNPGLWEFIQYINKHQIIANTNIRATIDLIASIYSGLPDSEQLDVVVILTDNQFDSIVDSSGLSGYTAGEYFKKKFRDINRTAPLACFWNLNAQYSDSPAEPSDNGIVMLSGYNHKMLESFVDTIDSASKASYEELKFQRHKAFKLLDEQRAQQFAQQQEDNAVNTYQVMLDFVSGDFSIPLRRALNDIKTGIFSNYTYVSETEENDIDSLNTHVPELEALDSSSDDMPILEAMEYSSDDMPELEALNLNRGLNLRNYIDDDAADLDLAQMIVSQNELPEFPNLEDLPVRPIGENDRINKALDMIRTYSMW